MQLYTEIITLKISISQRETLAKMKSRNIKVSNFIRLAIAEKIKRDASELIIKIDEPYCPW